MLLMLIVAAFADCPADVDTHLAELEAAPEVTADAVDALLACHPLPLAAAQAARVHALYGRSWATSDPERAARHLYAAWEADPFLDVDLPANNDAAKALAALQEADAPLPTPTPAPFLTIDGHPSNWLRTGHPAVIQAPGRPAVLLDDAHPFALPAVAQKSGGKSKGLLVAGIGSAVVAGGLYAGAWTSRARYQDLIATDGPNEMRQQSHDTTNALSIGAVVGAVASAGLLTVHITR